MAKPLVILRPAPPQIERIFTADALDRLHTAYEVHVLEETPEVEERFDALLPLGVRDHRPARPAGGTDRPGGPAAGGRQRRGQLPAQRRLRRLLRARRPRAQLRTGASIGLIGFGNLGRALHRPLQPFRPTLRIHDPWLPDAAELDRVRPGARLVLVSRAAVVDYDALRERVAEGRFLAAVDVWPDEPVPADHPARDLPPVRMQVAQRELVTRYRSRPVT